MLRLRLIRRQVVSGRRSTRRRSSSRRLGRPTACCAATGASPRPAGTADLGGGEHIERRADEVEGRLAGVRADAVHLRSSRRPVRRREGQDVGRSKVRLGMAQAGRAGPFSPRHAPPSRGCSTAIPRQLRSARRDGVDRRRRPPGLWPWRNRDQGCRRVGHRQPRVAQVALAMCGVSTTLGASTRSGWTRGSPRERRESAAAMRFRAAAAASATSSTTPPRAMLVRSRSASSARVRPRRWRGARPANTARRGSGGRPRGVRACRRSAFVRSGRDLGRQPGAVVIDHLHAEAVAPRRDRLADAAHAETRRASRRGRRCRRTCRNSRFRPLAAARKCSDSAMRRAAAIISAKPKSAVVSVGVGRVV